MLGTDNHVRQASSPDGGNTWSWSSLPGQPLTARPTAAWYGGALHVFARGDLPGTPSVLLHQVLGAGWDNLGGTLGSAPTATTFGGGLVVCAAGTYAHLFGLLLGNSTWGRVSADNIMTTDRGAVGGSYPRLFWRGPTGDLRTMTDGLFWVPCPAGYRSGQRRP